MSEELSPICGARKTDGSGTCSQVAGFGTSHVGYGRCKFHGGASPNGEKFAMRERARHTVDTLGLPADIDPQTALLEEVQRTAGHVRWLADLVAELDESGLKQITDDARGRIWEKPSVWMEMYQAERAHLVRASAEAIKCGVSERLVRLAENYAEQLVGVLTAFASALGLDPRSPQVIDAVSRVLDVPSLPEPVAVNA